MAMEVSIEINGRTVRVPEGKTVMEAAVLAGIHIPHFCWHEKLSIAANCRMCLVEIAKAPKPLPACATPVVDGMIVNTDSHAAKQAQNGVMEFLLINHPLDCPICDQGGECQLQDLAVGYGVSRSRYEEEKRVVFEKQLGPLISTDMTRCIHCTRCVRFGREVAGVMELGMTGRGEHAEIMPFVEKTVDSELSGNMIDVCPVGALTSKPFRFTARPWELQKKPGIAAHDSWGSNVRWECKGSEVKRVTPQENENINECWISDRDRFSYLSLGAKDRGKAPLQRGAVGNLLAETPWPVALETAALNLQTMANKHGADKVGFLASPNATLEELYLLQKLARALGCENIDHRLRRRDFGGGSLSEFGLSIGDIRQREHLFLIGANPAAEQPLLAHILRRRQKRLKLSSVGAFAIEPEGAHVLSRPSRWSQSLDAILRAAGGDNKVGGVEEKIGKLIASKSTAVLFGGGAEESPYYSALLSRARELCDKHNATMGMITGGANGAGAVKVGAMPRAGGLNTAQMLRAELKAVVMFQCEPDDFSESELLKRALANADYVLAIGTHIGGARGYARSYLPLAAPPETDGTFINGEGRMQPFAAAAKPPGEAREGWKILRMLGEKLGVDEFDFASFADIEPQLVGEDFYLGCDITAASESGGDGEGLELANGAAIYDVDILTRRAEALQKTGAGKRAARALMNPADMAKLNLSDGDEIRLSDGDGGEAQHFVLSESRVAEGVVVARAGGLLRTDNLRAEKVAEVVEEQAA